MPKSCKNDQNTYNSPIKMINNQFGMNQQIFDKTKILNKINPSEF
jgi:hypothetical protein